jgi:flavin-binding protein dodecin
MRVAKIGKTSATSSIGFDDAMARGIERANKALKNSSGAWIIEMKICVQDGKIAA